MITFEDIDKLTDIMCELPLNDNTVEAWGIESKGLKRWIRFMTLLAARDLNNGSPIMEEIQIAYTVGFEVGYRLALEAEQRRIANADV